MKYLWRKQHHSLFWSKDLQYKDGEKLNHIKHLWLDLKSIFHNQHIRSLWSVVTNVSVLLTPGHLTDLPFARWPVRDRKWTVVWKLADCSCGIQASWPLPGKASALGFIFTTDERVSERCVLLLIEEVFKYRRFEWNHTRDTLNWTLWLRVLYFFYPCNAWIVSFLHYW